MMAQKYYDTPATLPLAYHFGCWLIGNIIIAGGALSFVGYLLYMVW